VTNTGNCTDAFTVTVSGDVWPTALSITDTGTLTAGVGTDVVVTVTIPPTSSCGDFDTITVTATSQGDGTASDNSVLTTSANAVYGVEMMPPTDAKAADPGETVTYTLQVTNTGNCTDTFTVTVSGNLWATDVPTNVGPLASGAGTDVVITVTVPTTALCGDFDAVTVTATSYSNPAIGASSVLTTSANTVRGVGMTPPTAARSGDPGETVTYTLRVTNTGNCTDAFTVTASGNVWTTTLSITDTGSLAAGGGTDVVVTVTIPPTAQCGDFDAVTVTATSHSNPAISDSSVLTTSANAVYGVEMTPPTDTKAANPGETVTYTLRVTNTGNCTDAFTVTVSGNVWPTALSTTDTGDLASGAGADVVVTVTIPLAAQCGDFDVAIVTVTSHSNPAVGDSSVLTTRTFEPDIEVDPLSLSAVLEPGGQTVRQLTISNAPTATADLNWHLAEAPAATWLSESPGNGTLAPAMSDTVNVTFDATGLSNGTYNTMLRISSNDPDELVVGVGVTLVVTSCIPVSDAAIITPTEPRVDKPATFTATVDPASTIPINYIWDFGDGTPPVESDWVYAHTYVVQHTYTASDTYHVVMTATNCAGASVSTASADVAVLGEPVIGVEPLSLSAVLNPNVDAGQTKPRHLTISNGADATTDLIWRLVEMPTVTWLEEAPTSGVISPSGESSVEVIFNSMGVGPGTHTTTLRVASNDLDDPAVDVDVTLEVVEGCINIKGADFDFAPQGPITAGATLVFTGSVEQGGLPIDYTWDFGDGTPPVVQTDVWAQISVVTHTYTGEEVGYNVRMTVHNCGGEVIVSKRVGGSAVYLPLVLRNYPPCAPVEITALDSDSPVELGETMHFTATAEGTPPIVYNWDFGGAGTRGGTDTNPTFTYEMTGTYTVTLEVENDCGTDTASIMVTVTSPACIPAEITNLEDNNSVVLGEAAYFTATVNGTRPITYTWDFDSDGTPEQIGVGLNVVSHTYTETGPYVVTLDVENACGTDRAITAVIVSGGTRADFTFTPTAPPVILPDTWDADERRRR